MTNFNLSKWVNFHELLVNLTSSISLNSLNIKNNQRNDYIPKIIIIRFFIALFFLKSNNNVFEISKISDIPGKNCSNLLNVYRTLSLKKFFQNIEFDSIKIFNPKQNPEYEKLFDLSQLEQNFIELVKDVSIIEAEDLGVIYENILNIGEKARGGVHYTQSNIANFMSNKSLIDFFFKNGEEDLNQLIANDNVHQKPLKNKLENLKIIDPACGSGVFLIEFFKILFQLHLKFYDEIAEDGIQHLKESIIMNNLYGIDINRESIFITKIIIKLLLYHPKFDDIVPKYSLNFISGDSIDNTKNNFGNIKFDIVIGNPPWGISPKGLKVDDELKFMFKGQIDSSMFFFLQHLISLLKDDGIISYLLPNEFSLNFSYKSIREFLLSYNIISFINLGFYAFQYVTRPSLVLTVKNSRINNQNLAYIVKNIPKNLLASSNYYFAHFFKFIVKNRIYLDLDIFKKDVDCKFSLWMTLNDISIISKYFINNKFYFRDFLTNGRGIDTNKNGTYFICPTCSYLNPPFGVGQASKIETKVCVNKNCDYVFKRSNSYNIETIILESDYDENLTTDEFIVPGIIGSDLDRFRFKRKFRKCYYYGKNLNNNKYKRYSSIGWKNPTLYTGEKILFRKVSTGFLPIINFHKGFLLFNQQIYCFKLKKNCNHSLKFFFAIISSRLFYYYQIIKNNDPEKTILSHFTQKEILDFPFVQIETESELYQKIIKFTLEFLSLVNSEIDLNEKNQYDNIERHFNIVDNFVFDLYKIHVKEDRNYIVDFTNKYGFRVI